MALDAGELTLQLEYAHGLKDKDWMGRQDPYVVLQCGAQRYRSRTHVDGGKNPVWHETFRFNVINENDVVITVMEEDAVLMDEVIGIGRAHLARARVAGTDHQQVALFDKRKGKQRGTVQLSLTFVRNAAAQGVPGAIPHGAVSGHYAPSVAYGGYLPSAPTSMPHPGASSGYLPAPTPYPPTAPPCHYAPSPAPIPYGQPALGYSPSYMPHAAPAPSPYLPAPYTAPPSPYAQAYPPPHHSGYLSAPPSVMYSRSITASDA